jgi:hypothetical protein
MNRHLFVNLAVLAALVLFVGTPSGFGQTGERHSLTRETIKLTGKSGLISLFLETAPPNRANAPSVNRLKINLFLENGKISLIGENGSICGIIGDSGRPVLMIGTQVIGFYDGSGKRVGGIDANGNIRFIIGDSGRLALTGAYGREVAYIGENGIISFRK